MTARERRISVWLPLTIGEAIKVLRKRMKLSTKKLADRAGIPENLVLALERDDLDVELSTLSAVCDVLGYWFHINLAEVKPDEKEQ